MSTPKTKIQKGKALESYVADQINKKGLDTNACRSIGSGSGTREKSDISTNLQVCGRNVGIECKNHKTIHLIDWWEQTEKLEVLGREPILVIKPYKRAYEETLAILRLDTLLDLIALQGGKYSELEAIRQESKFDDFKAKNVINNLNYWLRELKKIVNIKD